MKNKKFLSVCLLSLTATSLSGCGGTTIPDVSEGKDTIVNELKGKPSDNDAKSVVFATLGKLNAYQTYTKKSQNTVSASKGFINYTQNTDATMIKNGDEYYVDSSSKSAFVDMQHIALVKNNKVAYHDKNSEIKSATYDDYYKVYGVTPDKLLSGQVFNQETILLATLTESSDNKYTYKLVLDKEKANDLLAHQTQVFGGLNGLPTYLDHTEFDLTIDDTYTPISYTYKAKYNISVNVLGDLTCTESCSATFEKFNETVEIPNSSELNKAINETPTKIDVDDNSKDYGDLSDLISAALMSDFVNGVSISGNLKIKDFSLPIKLKMKADVENLIDSGDYVNSIDVELIVNTFKGEVSFLFHQNKLYVNLLGKKVVFALPEADVSFDKDELDISSFLTVTKSEDKANTYSVKFTENALMLFKAILSSYGLIGFNDTVSFNTDVYVTNNHIAGIYVDFKVNDKSYLSTDFLYQDEAFTLPDLTKYVSNLSFGTSFKFDIGSAKENKVDLQFNYNTLETNFLKALDLKLTFTPSDAIKSKLSIGASFGMPYSVASLSTAKYMDITLNNGILSIVTTSDSGVSYFESTNLNEFVSTPWKLNAAGNAANNASSDIIVNDFNISSLISAIRVSTTLDGLKINLDEDYVLANIDTLQVQGQVNSFMIKNLGEVGSSLMKAFNLNYPIANFELSVPFNQDEKVSLAVLGYSGVDTATSTWNEKTVKNLDKTTLLKFSVNALSEEDMKHDYSFDADELAKIQETAQEYAAEYYVLAGSYALTDEYKASVEAYKTKYDALERNVKYWVNTLISYTIKTSGYGSNKKEVFPADDLLNTFTSNKTVADAFIKNPTYKVYKNLNEAQIEYVNSVDATLISTLLENQKASEATSFASYLTNLNNFEFKDMSNMTIKEALSYYTSAKNLVSQKNNFLSTDEAIDEFVEKVKVQIVPTYVEIANKFILEFADKYLNFELTDSLTFDEIVSDYNSYKNLFNTYYNTFNSVIEFSECVGEEEATSFLNNILLAQYYFDSGLGNYSKSLVKSADKYMADILSETDAAVVEEKLYTLLTFFDSDYKDYRKTCSNYDELYAKHGDLIDQIDDELIW